MVLDTTEESIREHDPLLWLAVYKHKTHKDVRLTYNNYLFMKALYTDKSDYIVVQKSTQCGVSEYLVVRALYSLMLGRSVFYVMPTDGMRNIFVTDRFNRSVSYSPFYANHFAGISKKDTDNAGLKIFGKGSINFVGSVSPRPFYSYPADELIIDELDQCDQSNIAIADERLSASTCKQVIKVSNPTTLGFGINKEFNLSDKKQWHIKCDYCGEWIKPDFFNHVVREVEQGVFVLRDNDIQDGQDIKMICRCGKPINRFNKGQWIPERLGVLRSGYHISKLFSTNVSIRDMVNKFEEGLTNDTTMQRFYNGDLGLAYSSSGAKITPEALDRCKRDYPIQRSSERVTIMGVDVGTMLHTIIAEIDPDGYTRIVYIGKPRELKELFQLISQFKVRFGCIDAMPETRLSKELCYKVRGFFMVYYGSVKKETVNTQTRTVIVNRTESLDRVKEAVNLELVHLPVGIDKMMPVADNGFSEFYNQIGASTRLYDEAKGVYYWDEGSAPDHYMHALNYLLVAKKLIVKASK